jgi:hypothetical protein
MKKVNISKLIFLVEAELIKHKIVGYSTGSGGYGNYSHSHSVYSSTLKESLSHENFLKIEKLIKTRLPHHKDFHELLIFIPYFVAKISEKFDKAYIEFFETNENLINKTNQETISHHQRKETIIKVV